jgi:hypothetical protein
MRSVAVHLVILPKIRKLFAKLYAKHTWFIVPFGQVHL